MSKPQVGSEELAGLRMISAQLRKRGCFAGSAEMPEGETCPVHTGPFKSIRPALSVPGIARKLSPEDIKEGALLR